MNCRAWVFGGGHEHDGTPLKGKRRPSEECQRESMVQQKIEESTSTVL